MRNSQTRRELNTPDSYGKNNEASTIPRTLAIDKSIKEQINHHKKYSKQKKPTTTQWVKTTTNQKATRKSTNCSTKNTQEEGRDQEEGDRHQERRQAHGQACQGQGQERQDGRCQEGQEAEVGLHRFTVSSLPTLNPPANRRFAMKPLPLLVALAGACVFAHGSKRNHIMDVVF